MGLLRLLIGIAQINLIVLLNYLALIRTIADKVLRCVGLNTSVLLHLLVHRRLVRSATERVLRTPDECFAGLDRFGYAFQPNYLDVEKAVGFPAR